MDKLIESEEIVRVSVGLVASMPNGQIAVTSGNRKVETTAPLWQGNTLTVEGDRHSMPIFARQLREVANEIDRVCGVAK